MNRFGLGKPEAGKPGGGPPCSTRAAELELLGHFPIPASWGEAFFLNLLLQSYNVKDNIELVKK